MGNKTCHSPYRQASICLEVRNLVHKKHKQFPELKASLAKQISQCSSEVRKSTHICQLKKIVKEADSRECTIPFHELELYLIANLQNNFVNGKEFLKSKRKEFFSFARQNLLKNSEFIMSKLIRQLNLAAKQKAQIFNSSQMKELLSLAMQLTKMVLKWFYGFRIFTGLCKPEEDDTHTETICEIYISELAQCLLYFQRNERNYLHKMRFRLIELEIVELNSEVVNTIKSLRTVQNKKIDALFPKEDETSYNIIFEYIERMAQAQLLTTKFKFICIIIEAIPCLFLESERRRHNKQSSAAKRTFCATPERTYSVMGPQTGTITGSFGRSWEFEYAYSQLLSVDNKRELLKYLLIEWYKKSKYCIVQDLYIPLQMLQNLGYIEKLEQNITLSTFMHSLFEVVGVEADMEDQILQESYIEI